MSKEKIFQHLSAYFDEREYNLEVKNGASCDHYLLCNTHRIPFLYVVVLSGDFSDTDLSDIWESNDLVSSMCVINDEGCNFYRKNRRVSRIEKLKFETIFPSNSGKVEVELIPLDSNLEGIFFSLHSFLRDIDGLHSDDALDEICKLIFIKIYCEKEGVFLIKSNFSCAEEVFSVIQSLYKKALVKYRTKQQYPSDSINLSPTAILQLVLKLEKYSFSSSPMDVKGRAFQNLISPSLRSGMGQYFTPKPIISFIVKCISPRSEEMIIDPFCGSGHFLIESCEFLKGEVDLSEYISNKLFGFEKNDKMFRVALTDALLLEGGVPNIDHTDALLDIDSYEKVVKGMFDVVMTNPPFGSTIGKDVFSNIGEFELLKDKKTIPLEVIGLERSVQVLKVGGRLAIVLPDSIFLNKNMDYVREWMLSNLSIRSIISLPLETFSPYGAHVKTSVMFASKKSHCDKSVLMGGIENIGYDFSGKIKADADIEAMVDIFQDFINKEGW